MHTPKDEDEYTYWSIREESEKLTRTEGLIKLLLILPFTSTLLILVIVFVLFSR
ncbi:MAG: hypothetical protein ACK4FV_02490 [Candidatus Nitrosocaldus sp.]